MRPIQSFLDFTLYWTSRRFLLRLNFLVRRFFYVRQERIRESSQAASIVLSLVGNVWKVGLASIVTITLLEIAEHACHEYLSLVLGYLPGWSIQMIQSLRNFIQLDKNVTTQFLDTVASISGVFLGLYFTAISVVAGSMFSNIPSVIRQQLVREKVGNLYVKGLAFLCSTSILLLGYQSMGGSPGILSLLLVITLCVFGALSFFLLGKRVFNFFDHYELAKPIFVDLQDGIRHATTNGFAWDNSNFQAHYQKIASQHLDSLRTFIQTLLSMKEKEEEPLVRLVQRSGYLLSEYQREKRRIPTSSKWFESTPVHRNWFLAESTELTVALNTYVGIQPKLQPNLYWFEEELTQILQLALSEILGRGGVQNTYRMLQPLSQVLKTYGEEFALEEAGKIIAMIAIHVDTLAKSLDNKIANRIQSNDYNLGLVDYYGYSILNFVMGFFDGVRTNVSSSFRRRSRSISWENPKSIYSKGFSGSMLSQMEFVQRTVAFEKSVEGRTISPSWYRDQLVVMQHVRLISAGLRKTIELLSSEFVDIAKTFLDRRQVVFAAMHAQRGLEVCEKIRYNASQNREQIESFETFRTARELPWPDWEWNKVHDDLRSRRESLIETLASCLPLLAVIDRPKDAPDVFGQSYNHVYHHVISLLEGNRADEFGRVFPSLFAGAMLAYEKLQKEEDIAKADVKSKLVFGTEPVIDILDLSGYAKIYSELYLNAKLWDVCTTTWDKHFDNHSNTSHIIKFFVTIVKYRKSLYSLIPRDIIRTNWELQLNGILRKENLIDDIGQRGYFGDEPPLEHINPFIRALCAQRCEPFVSAIEVFILTYLLKRPEAEDIEFKDNHDFLRYLAEESKRQSLRKAEGKEE